MSEFSLFLSFLQVHISLNPYTFIFHTFFYQIVTLSNLFGVRPKMTLFHYSYLENTLARVWRQETRVAPFFPPYLHARCSEVPIVCCRWTFSKTRPSWLAVGGVCVLFTTVDCWSPSLSFSKERA